MDKKAKGILEGAAIGVLAGAIAGVLFAPKSGKETRAEIGKYLHEMKDKIADELTKTGEVTKEKYSEIVGRIVSGYETSKKITAEDSKDIKKRLEENYEEVSKAVKKPVKK